jgi:hypothetical protein
MTVFAAPASSLEAKAPDPSKHVNYTLGMVLGVDDFNQEFAYLAGRDRWLARDAVGYGTLAGLRVASEATANGPRLTVSSGAALSPRGRLMCVKPDQCGDLNQWLAANKAKVPGLLGSPLVPTLRLYLVLGYRECPADPVPIPGEPCRSESELLAPSRLVDDFCLELVTSAPDQREEDLLREFVAWMRSLAFGGGGPYATVSGLEAALRAAVQAGPGSPLASPPPSPLTSPLGSPGVHFNFGSPLGSLRLDPALAPEYARAAFRVWATEIRPLVHEPCTTACGCGCSQPPGPAASGDDRLLLARVDVPVVNVGGDEWRVDDTHLVQIDESRRPVLASLRLLQEWTLAGSGGLAGAPAARPVAAGIVGAGGAQAPALGHPTVAVPGGSVIRINFDGYAPPSGTFQYVVKAMAVAGGISNPTIAFDSFAPGGVQLRVTNGAAAVADGTLSAMQFMVEITRIG